MHRHTCIHTYLLAFLLVYMHTYIQTHILVFLDLMYIICVHCKSGMCLWKESVQCMQKAFVFQFYGALKLVFLTDHDYMLRPTKRKRPKRRNQG